MTWIDKAVPWFIGHRSQITGVAVILFNAARLIAGLLGHPIPDVVGQDGNAVLGGAGLAFLAAKIDRRL